jgi:hypothetical protein
MHALSQSEQRAPDQFAICNLQSSITNDFPTRASGVPPENASARLPALAEAFSSQNSTEPNDGMATCRSTATVQTLVGCCSERSVTETEPPGAVMDRAGLSSSFPPLPSVQLKLKAHQLREGARKLAIIHRVVELIDAKHTWESISRTQGVPAPTLIQWMNQAARLMAERLQIPVPAKLTTHNSQLLTSSDCAPQNHKAGRPPKVRLTPGEDTAIRAALLQNNLNCDAGSVQEAVRMARRKGELSPDLLAEVNRREASGLPLLPEAAHRAVSIAPVIVHQHRNPTDADLDYISAPGTMMWLEDELTNFEKVFARAGDVLEADDATINFPVCIPWQIGGCKVSDRWGVKVGRFQWLVAIDVASRYIPGFSYTARPRSSYRAEDIVSLLLGVFRTFGIWRRCRFERGVFESNRVTTLLAQLGILHKPVWSPHQKPFIEGLFNALWTKLSDLPGQVGRFQGEMEDGNTLLTKCLSGSTDPRRHFPMIEDALAAMHRVIAERNQTPIKSPNYGTWIPAERWAQQVGSDAPRGPLRRLDPASEFLFAPWIGDWTVQGTLVGGSVNLGNCGLDGKSWSVRFDFGAEFLLQFDGCKVKAYFDPSTTRGCEATIVLAENVRSHRAGEVLGVAPQVNEVARYARRVLGYGNDADLGLELRQKAASALRREVRSILPNGKQGPATSEVRDGLGNNMRVEVGRASSPSPGGEGARRADEGERAMVKPDPSAFATRQETRSRLAAIASKLREDA